MTDTQTATRTWTRHASQLQGKTGPFYVNFGGSPQVVAFYAPSKTARTIAVTIVEDSTGEYIGVIKGDTGEISSIRRRAIDPWDAISSERNDIFDFDGEVVNLKVMPFTARP